MKKVQMKPDVNNSLLGFGCMRFPTKHNKIDREKTFEMLRYAYEHGVNHFDTAYGYHDGESEIVLGEFLKTIDRSTVTVSTKLPIWLVKKEQDFDRLLEEQMKKLQVDYLDFYLLHALNKERWELAVNNNIFDFFKRIKEKGLVRYVGFSFHDDKETFLKIAKSYNWDMCLLQINYLDFEEQQGKEGYKYMEEHNIPVWVMEPLKGGRLTTIADDIYQVMKDVNPDDSQAKWGFRWVHSLPGVKLILSGMSTLEQVKENCEIFSNIEPLNEKELQVIEKVKEMIKTRVKVKCTSCNYCIPCPNGVNIPRNFRIYNNSYMYNNIPEGKDAYKYHLKEEEKAYNCIECGECLDKCPQHLPIPDLLKEVHQVLG